MSQIPDLALFAALVHADHSTNFGDSGLPGGQGSAGHEGIEMGAVHPQKTRLRIHEP